MKFEYDAEFAFKFSSDANEYFKKFLNIPKLKDGSKVALFAISNLDCLVKIIEKNPNCEYFVYDLDTMFELLKVSCQKTKLNYIEDYKVVQGKHMFDCFIFSEIVGKQIVTGVAVGESAELKN